MSWFGWFVLGFALLAGEVLVSASFFLLFFGLGALLVGALGGIGIGLAPWLEWFVFAVVSVVLLVVFRSRLLSQLGVRDRGSDADSLVGTRGRVTVAIPAAGRGHGDFRGSSWQVRNIGPTPLAVGDECDVKAVDGLTLDVLKVEIQ